MMNKKTCDRYFSVLTFNIWNGFEKSEREEIFVDFMRKESPDIVALQELCGFNQKRFAEMAERYGHPYARLLKRTGYPVGISSKTPIKVKRKQRFGFWHDFLHCVIDGMDFIVVHLSPAQAKYRQKEMRKLVNYIQQQRLNQENSFSIVLGDFNAHSPLDKDALQSRPEIKENYSKENLIDGDFDFSVIQGFLDIGLRDVLDQVDPQVVNQWTFPADALEPDQEKMNRGERLDFQLISPAFQRIAVDGDIVIDPYTRLISDHYPVKMIYCLENLAG